MDKTIEVVLVAVVVIATAAIMLFIFTGESSNFSDFVSNAITGAEEDLDDTMNDGEDGPSDPGDGAPDCEDVNQPGIPCQ